MSYVRDMTCCVCGNAAKAKKQWWNRDRGYGLCGSCATWLKAKPDYDEAEFTSCYGEEGVHWMPEVKMKKKFKVTVRDQVTRYLTKVIEAEDQEEAKDIAGSEEWNAEDGWEEDELRSQAGDCGIDEVEEVTE